MTVLLKTTLLVFSLRITSFPAGYQHAICVCILLTPLLTLAIAGKNIRFGVYSPYLIHDYRWLEMTSLLEQCGNYAVGQHRTYNTSWWGDMLMIICNDLQVRGYFFIIVLKSTHRGSRKLMLSIQD